MRSDEFKHCKVCGRKFFWQKRWEKDWTEIKVCSQKCRRQKVQQVDLALEAAILELIAQRNEHGSSGSICPSEAARRVCGDDWQNMMERTRQAARRLANAGKIMVMQGNKPVDPSDVKGPIRLGIQK